MSAYLSPLAVPLEGRRGRVDPKKEAPARYHTRPYLWDIRSALRSSILAKLDSTTQVHFFDTPNGEPEHPVRAASRAITRLGYTDVNAFIDPEYVNVEDVPLGKNRRCYRRRIHSGEVRDDSMFACEDLSLNPELAGAIALWHDAGHPPFGHDGERGIQDYMKGQGVKKCELFEHNRHCRDLLCSPPDPSVNPMWDVVDGVSKHLWRVKRKGITVCQPPTLEAAIVNEIDDAAYLPADIVDAHFLGCVTWDKLVKRVSLVSESVIPYQKKNGVLFHVAANELFVSDLIDATRERMSQAAQKGCLSDATALAGIVGYSPRMQVYMKECKSFMYEEVYQNRRMQAMRDCVRNLMRTLCEQTHERCQKRKKSVADILDFQKKHDYSLPTAIAYSLARGTETEMLVLAECMGINIYPIVSYTKMSKAV